MMKKSIFLIAALVIQCSAIGWLIFRYERVVAKGTEVRFNCQAYDPYDPLRGRYLRVNVRESTTNIAEEVRRKIDSSDGYRPILEKADRKAVLVRVEPNTNGVWRVVEAAFTPSNEGVWIKPKDITVDYLSYSEREDKEDWSEFKKRRKASGVFIQAEMPNQLFINETIAKKAEKILQEATSVKGKKGAVAVYRVLNNEIVITDIEIKDKSVKAIAKER
jgi:hypothetical protein